VADDLEQIERRLAEYNQRPGGRQRSPGRITFNVEAHAPDGSRETLRVSKLVVGGVERFVPVSSNDARVFIRRVSGIGVELDPNPPSELTADEEDEGGEYQ
jgi:hypothetical protein